MKTLLVILSLFVLSGCETVEWTSVSVGTSYGHHNHISYSLGFYTGSHYRGYPVHGAHGHRYYYAPRNYAHHHYYPQRHYVRPVVVHQHVHVASCYVRGGHSYSPPRPRHHSPPHNNRTPRVTRNDHRDDSRHDRKRKHNRRSDRREDIGRRNKHRN